MGKSKEKEPTTLVGYKGFDKEFKCRNVKYEVGKTKKHRGDIQLCSTGLHFCENPLDVLSYYPLTDSRFALVEADGVSDETSNDSKRVAKSLTIKAELNLEGLIKAGFNFIFDKVDWTNAKGGTSATSGNRAHSATSGYGAHSATSGEYAHSATSGEYAHSATSGNRAHSATSGNDANSATSGNDAHSATSGEYAHSATSGNRANSATSGYGAHSATSGNDAIACSVGRQASASASIGCWLVLAEWSEDYDLDNVKPLDVQSVKVDGKEIKADTFYKLENGKFVEV